MKITMKATQIALLILGLVYLPGAWAGWYGRMGYNERWVFGHATWYGDPWGEGSSGGNCGYTELRGSPYGVKVAAGSPAIYQNGLGCGQCYRVACLDNHYGPKLCNPQGTTIVITDFCPGGTYCSTGEKAFDLSGAAISAMAYPGKADQLRNRGLYNILYKRVPCRYRGQNIAFKVDSGSSAYWLNILVKYVGGPGDVSSVSIKQHGSYSYQPLNHNWGGYWMLINYSGQPFKGPFSIRVTSRLNGHSVIANGVIPAYFSPGQTYNSRVQLAY